MKTVKSILVFRNLNIAVCDDAGQQIPVLQTSLLTLLAEHAERHDYDLAGVTVETPDGNWKMRRTEDGSWNRDFV